MFILVVVTLSVCQFLFHWWKLCVCSCVFDILGELQEEADKVQEAQRENALAGNICGVLLCAAVCSYVLQCVVVCCSVFLCAAVCCCVLQCGVVCCSVAFSAAVCCCVLHCCMHLNGTLPHLSNLWCIAVCCCVLQRCRMQHGNHLVMFVLCCSVMQYNAMCRKLHKKCTTCTIHKVKLTCIHTYLCSSNSSAAQAEDAQQLHSSLQQQLQAALSAADAAQALASKGSGER